MGFGAAALLAVIRLVNAERMHRDTAWSKFSDALSQVSRFVHDYHDQKLTLNSMMESQQHLERTVLELGISNQRLSILVADQQRGGHAHFSLVAHDSETTYLRGVLESQPDDESQSRNTFQASMEQEACEVTAYPLPPRQIAFLNGSFAASRFDGQEIEYLTRL